MMKCEIRGVDHLIANLHLLSEELRGDATRKALTEACKVYEMVYKSLLPRGTQYKLKPRIKEVTAYKIWKFPDGMGFAGIIGTKSGMAPHAHLIEDGTKYRFRTGDVKNGGRGGIGGRFKFLMKPKWWKNRPKTQPAFRGAYRVGGGTRPYSLNPGDPPTRTGMMPAYHPLAMAAAQSHAAAERVFADTLVAEINKPIFPTGA